MINSTEPLIVFSPSLFFVGYQYIDTSQYNFRQHNKLISVLKEKVNKSSVERTKNCTYTQDFHVNWPIKGRVAIEKSNGVMKYHGEC